MELCTSGRISPLLPSIKFLRPEGSMASAAPKSAKTPRKAPKSAKNEPKSWKKSVCSVRVANAEAKLQQKLPAVEMMQD
jgi:hypothetical protein